MPLAVVCGLAGLAFGAVMNLQLWVTYSGDHTAAKLGATFATSLPFDVAHAAGNVVFCLAFGPALVRALARFRTRMEVRWLPAPAAAAVALAALAIVLAARSRARSVGPECRRGRRLALGRLPHEGAERRRRLGRRARPALVRALHAAGRRSASPPPGATRSTPGARAWSPTCAPTPPTCATSGRSRARSCVFTAAGVSPRDVGGRDLVAELAAKRRRNGAFDGRVNTTAFAILALRAAGRSTSSVPVRSAGRWLAGQANRDGGFNFGGRGGPSGIDDTGAALQGLVAAGRKGTKTVRRAARFILKKQNPDGGFP